MQVTCTEHGAEVPCCFARLAASAQSALPCGESAAARRSTTADLADAWPESVMASSHRFGWRNLRAVHVRRGPGEAQLPAFEHHCVIVHLGAEVDVQVCVGSGAFTGRLGRGAISVIP